MGKNWVQDWASTTWSKSWSHLAVSQVATCEINPVLMGKGN